MNVIIFTLRGLSVILVLFITTVANSAPQKTSENHTGLSTFSSPEACKSCHKAIYDQWKESFHAKATTSPAFRGMFTLFDFSTEGKSARECLNCHATDVKLTGEYEPLRRAILEDKPATIGVTCNACHGIRSVKNIPDLLVPVTLRPVKSPFHNVERSPLFKKEVMCSACHDYNNSHAVQGDWERGVACCDTNRDFRKTDMAKRGVSCQTCHMAPGLDKNPKAWLQALKAGVSFKDRLLRLVNLNRYAEKTNPSDHRFPGSHDAKVLKTAVDVKMEITTTKKEVKVNLAVKNLTGHSIPNGCPPRARMFLRVWLEDEDGFEIDSHQVEYGFNFKDKDGYEPAMVDTAVERGFDHVLEAEKTERIEKVFPLSEDDGAVSVKASLSYVYFVMPPAEAQDRMQKGIIRRIEKGSAEQKDFILNVEIPGRMASMNRLVSAYPPVLMWHAERALISR